jgi:hypothetical protein
MRGSRDAIEMAQTKIACMGGAAVWRRATWVHSIEEVHRATERHASRSETWRSLADARIWGRSDSPESPQTFAWTPDRGWRLTAGTLAILTDVESWSGRAAGGERCMSCIGALLLTIRGLRVAREGKRRLAAGPVAVTNR